MNRLRRVKDKKMKPLKELRGREQQLNNLLVKINVIILEGDAESIDYVGGNAEQILGYRKEEWFSFKGGALGFWKAHLHPDDQDGAVEYFTRSIGKRNDHTFEYRMIAKNGKVVWLQNSVSVKTMDGTSVRVRSIMVDITKCKQLVETIRRKHDLAQRYLDIVGVMIVVINSNQEVELINRKGCEILGYNEDRIIGKNWFHHFLPKKNIDEVKNVFDRLMKGEIEPVEYFDNTVLCKSGEEKIIAWHNTILKDEDDSIIGTLSSGLDITERKQMEEALRDSESQYKALVEQSLVGIYLFNEEKFFYLNEAGASIFGYLPEEIVGRMKPLDLVSPIDRPLVLENLKKRLTGEVEEIKYTFRGLRKEGSEIDCEVLGRQILNHGKPTILGLCFDITRSKKMEEKLRESESRYRSLFEDSPISLWEEDYSEVKVYIDSLRDSGVKDFREYFKHHPEALVRCASSVKILDINNTTLQLFGAKNKEKLLIDLNRIFTEESYTIFRELLIALCEGGTIFESDAVNKTFSGKTIYVSIRWCVAPGFENNWEKVIVSILDISEKKKLENTLQESERHYRLLVDSANEGIGVIQDSRFCFVNPKLLEISGFTEEEIMSRPVIDFVYPEDREMVGTRLKRRITGENVDTNYAFRIFAKDKSVRWFLANSVRIEWVGRPATLNFLTDVSKHMAMEEKIETAAREWNTTFDAINHAIALLDSDRRVLRGNKALTKLLRNSFEKIIGHYCYERMNCKLESTETCPFNRMIRTRKRETEVMQLGESWIEGIIDPIFDDSGELRGAVYIVSDISERKQTEEKIRQQNEFLNTVMESLTHPFYIVDVRNYKIVLANPGAKQGLATNYSTCYQLTHDRDEPCNGVQHPCPVLEVTKKKRPVTVEHIHTSPEGNKRNFEIHAYPIFEDTGEVGQIIEYTIDITERRKAEEMAKAQQEQLLQADKMISLGILVSGVAHEINNPNNSIILNAQFLEKAWQSMVPILDEYQKENRNLQIGGIMYEKLRKDIPFLFSGIIDSSKRIKHIVDELKAFSRKDSDEVQAAVDMNAVVESAVNLMNNIIKKSTRNFKVSYEKQLPRIAGNYRKLEQVIINLVQNACQSLTSTDKQVFVSTCYDQKDRRVVVKVKDEGVGIPKEELKYILEPFFTTRRSSGGTGLGLSVSSRIINDYGGTLNFISHPNKGTTAEIRFPHYNKKIETGEKTDA
jgi:PAS domain S-box-containing protein